MAVTQHAKGAQQVSRRQQQPTSTRAAIEAALVHSASPAPPQRSYTVPVSLAAQLAPLWHALNDSTYSEALYGARCRLPAWPRVLWLRLMPPAAIPLIRGVCTAQSLPPYYPFYAFMDAIGPGNPLDAVWVHTDERARALPSHSWVEVTHCAQSVAAPTPTQEAECDALSERLKAARARNESESRISARMAFSCKMVWTPHLWQWRAGSMWFHVAPGSGVAINIGRTRAFTTTHEAEHFLARTLQRDGNRSWADCRSIRPKASGDADQLDSVQILQNREYYSSELRHEVIMLRHGECEALTNATATPAGGVRCGLRTGDALLPDSSSRDAVGAASTKICSQAALNRLARCGYAASVRQRHRATRALNNVACNQLDAARGGANACQHTTNGNGDARPGGYMCEKALVR